MVPCIIDLDSSLPSPRPLLHRVPLRFVLPCAFFGWPLTFEIVLPRIPTYLLGLTSPSPRRLAAKRIKIAERLHHEITRELSIDRTCVFPVDRQIFVLNNNRIYTFNTLYNDAFIIIEKVFRQNSPIVITNIKDIQMTTLLTYVVKMRVKYCLF